MFLRPVKSRILFEQMLGRGTRKGEQFPDKSHFVVFDCFNGTLLEYFRKATAITAEPPERETKTTAEIIEDIWNNRDKEYNIRCLAKRLQRIDKEMSGDARKMFAAYIPDGDVGAYASSLPASLRRNFSAAMKTLRDPAFQRLLVEYPRAPRTFVIAYQNEDVVDSEWRVHGLDGKEYKPQDYLAAFADFVQKNPSHIHAIRILLDRLRDWSTTALSELREKLARSPQRFTPENLQKAHEVQYKKALVDIISMVKHAADEHQPLYTAIERAERAFRKVTAGRTFTAEQQQWLDRIREHLRANLSIDQEDFQTMPIFTRPGGWSKASRAFGPTLPKLLNEFNEAIAA